METEQVEKVREPKELSVEGLKVIGAGYNGTVYRLTEAVLSKYIEKAYPQRLLILKGSRQEKHSLEKFLRQFRLKLYG